MNTMLEDKMQVGEISKPRFEFRSFGQEFGGAAERMARLSTPVPEKLRVRHSNEIYIMSRSNNINNTKIRAGKLDIKTHLQTVSGLEQWNPLLTCEFPVPVNVIRDQLFDAFQVEPPEFQQPEYTLDEFLSIVKNHQELQAVRVDKERFAYAINDTICEVGNVKINGVKLSTINSESTEIADIQKTLRAVGLTEYENINYLQAIKRIIGWIDKPLAS